MNLIERPLQGRERWVNRFVIAWKMQHPRHLRARVAIGAGEGHCQRAFN